MASDYGTSVAALTWPYDSRVPLIAYIDESGTANLATIDKRSPVFGLGFLICDSERYAAEIVPPVTKLKIDTFGHDAVILHSAEMRHRTGDFSILLNAQKRERFFDALNAIILAAPFELIAVAIRKREHLQRYGNRATDPYELALEFGLERLKPCMEERGQSAIVLVAESRNKNENGALRAAFDRLMLEGSRYHSFSGLDIDLRFAPKSANAVGHQLADICISPIARFADKKEKTLPFEIARQKIRQGGFKIFP
jgi:hypothetical protein